MALSPLVLGKGYGRGGRELPVQGELPLPLIVLALSVALCLVDVFLTRRNKRLLLTMRKVMVAILLVMGAVMGVTDILLELAYFVALSGTKPFIISLRMLFGNASVEPAIAHTYFN